VNRDDWTVNRDDWTVNRDDRAVNRDDRTVKPQQQDSESATAVTEEMTRIRRHDLKDEHITPLWHRIGARATRVPGRRARER
jgi:hypothetical protein